MNGHDVSSFTYFATERAEERKNRQFVSQFFFCPELFRFEICRKHFHSSETAPERFDSKDIENGWRGERNPVVIRLNRSPFLRPFRASSSGDLKQKNFWSFLSWDLMKSTTLCIVCCYRRNRSWKRLKKTLQEFSRWTRFVDAENLKIKDGKWIITEGNFLNHSIFWWIFEIKF